MANYEYVIIDCDDRLPNILADIDLGQLELGTPLIGLIRALRLAAHATAELNRRA
jgi:hypothetical protein